MKRISLLLPFFMLIPLTAQDRIERGVTGIWQGTLVPGGIRIVFHIAFAVDGSLDSKMDSPDQGAMGLPIQTTTLRGDSLILECSAEQIRQEGADNSEVLRYIAPKIGMANAADECTVTIIRRDPQHAYLNLTPDTIT